MPPLPEHRKEIYEYYRLQFLPDGMPGRKMKDGRVVPHPIYATYVIDNYLWQWRRREGAEYLEAARMVADAAISRMDILNGALVFRYTEEMGLTSLRGNFYSGLTQGRYLDVFHSMFEATGEQKYADAAEQVLASLMIPPKDGGVAFPAGGGIVIEEWPHELMPTYTLNGWTTAIKLVGEYAKKSGSEDAAKLFESNVVALRALLPLFDREELANSSYGLAGPAYVRLVIPDGGEVISAKITVPGEGIFPVAESGSGRWENYFLDSRIGSDIRVHALLSYISFPVNNGVSFTVLSDAAQTVSLEIQHPEFAPRQTVPVRGKWVELAKFEVSPGQHTVACNIPWDIAELIAYPTSFTKTIGGVNYNVYHFIHITNLRQLAEMANEPLFARYADRWDGYAEKWPQMTVYTSENISLRAYSPPLANAGIGL